MNLLHINSEFANVALYKNLLYELSKLNIHQINFASIKDINHKNNNIFISDKVDFKYSEPLKKHHRILYHKKIKFLEKDIEKKIDLNKVSLMHAHKLFSDGGVALKIKQKYSIPYIVAVRSTDINVFYKYMPHLKGYGEKILLNANKIILLNGHYKRKLSELHFDAYKCFLKNISIIPNGLDNIWFNGSVENIEKKTLTTEETIQIVYTGTFIKRKRVLELINAINDLRKAGIDIELTLIGEGGFYQNKVENYSNKYGFIHYLGKLTFNEILDVYKRMHIFVLPSVRETFGLVYLEALSQGLPIIYTNDEAIDSYFIDGEYGYAVKPICDDIAAKIKLTILNYDKIIQNISFLDFKQFSWEQIAKKYSVIYENILYD